MADTTTEQKTAVPAQVTDASADSGASLDPGALSVGTFPNILDQFDLSTYTLKLSVKRENNPIYRGNDEWVMAQTAVTATQIDDLHITTYATGETAGFVTFKLLQPGHVTLFDDLNINRARLGLNLSVRPPMFLEINFKGYTTDSEDNDQGGVPTNIAGPYLYKLIVLDISININEAGSEYDFRCVIENFFARTNVVQEIPTLLQLDLGGNLTQTFENLRKALDDYYILAHRGYDRRDAYEFVFSDPSLCVGPGPVCRNLASEPYDQNSLFDSLNDNLLPDYLADKKQLVESIEVSGGRIKILPGTKIEQVFLVLLSMLKTFRLAALRRDNPDEIENSTARPDKTFVKWFRVVTDTEILQWDSYRNDYARKYIYSLQLLSSARTDVGDKDERPQSLDHRQQRFTEITDNSLLRKAYYYIFTGKNDQITNLDISFSSGAALMNPPRDQLNPAGTFSTPNNATSPELNPEQIARARIEEAGKKLDAQLRSESETSAGYTDIDEPTPLMIDYYVERERTAYQNEVRAYEREFGTYTRNYSVNQQAQIIDRLMLKSATAPDFTQNGTYFGYSNTLFGYTAYQYHVANLGSSLFKINMTVRGDPWYLGKRIWSNSRDPELIKEQLREKRPIENQSAFDNPLEGCFYGDHTYIYLAFSTPRMDLNSYDDEDDDDGYIRYANKNGNLLQAFSGIYLVQGVNNRFANGEYFCEIQGVLLTELDATQFSNSIRPVDLATPPQTSIRPVELAPPPQG